MNWDDWGNLRTAMWIETWYSGSNSENLLRWIFPTDRWLSDPSIRIDSQFSTCRLPSHYLTEKKRVFCSISMGLSRRVPVLDVPPSGGSSISQCCTLTNRRNPVAGTQLTTRQSFILRPVRIHGATWISSVGMFPQVAYKMINWF